MVVDLVQELQDHGAEVVVADPHADERELAHDHGLALGEVSAQRPVDALVVAVAHREYRSLSAADLRALVRGDRPVIADVKSLYDAQALMAAGFTVFRL